MLVVGCQRNLKHHFNSSTDLPLECKLPTYNLCLFLFSISSSVLPLESKLSFFLTLKCKLRNQCNVFFPFSFSSALLTQKFPPSYCRNFVMGAERKSWNVLFIFRYLRCSSNWKSCPNWQNLRRVSWRSTSRAFPSRSWTMTSTTLAPWEGDTNLEDFCNELYLLLIQNEVAAELGPEGKNPVRQRDWRQRISMAGINLFHVNQARSNTKYRS